MHGDDQVSGHGRHRGPRDYHPDAYIIIGGVIGLWAVLTVIAWYWIGGTK